MPPRRSKIDRESADPVLREAKRRGLLTDASWELRASSAVEAAVAWTVQPQRDLMLDAATLSAAYCTRQCGKTGTVARDMIVTALERPDRTCTYVNATYGEARRIMWEDPEDGLPAVLRQRGLSTDGRDPDVRLNISRMTAAFRNGSIVELMGADNEGFERLRGNKRDLIVVDEAQKIVGLKAAMPVLTFCIQARHGRIVLIGTPNEMCRGYFHDACTGAEPGWSVHRWSMRDNTKRPDIWEGALRTKALMRQADDDPDWLREGCGLWVRSEAGLVVPTFSTHAGVPQLVADSRGAMRPRSKPLVLVAGMDLGFDPDPTAIVVWAYSMEEGIPYEVFSGQRGGEDEPGFGTEEQASWMREVATTFPGLKRFVVDSGGQGKQIADDFRRRHTRAGLTVVPARKHNRDHMIEELRTSLRLGTTLLRDGSELASDLKQLRWDPERWEDGERAIARVEGPDGRLRKADHRFDAARYGWWDARAFLAGAMPGIETEDERREREADEHMRKVMTAPFGGRPMSSVPKRGRR